MKTLILLISLLIISHNGYGQVNVGEPAPDFSLQRLDVEESITLSELNGKVVYIFFYGANCPHCQANGPVTESDIYQKYKDNPNFAALGLDTWNDSRASNETFRSLTEITYPLLLQARESLRDYYGNTSSYDRSVVIGSDGILKYKGTEYVNTDVDDVQQIIETELNNISTSIETSHIPDKIILEQNYPNPFNPVTVITYQVPGSFSTGTTEHVQLDVFDALGRHVSELVNQNQRPGSHSVRFDASSLTSGLYIYRLEAGGTSLVRKMTLLK